MNRKKIIIVLGMMTIFLIAGILSIAFQKQYRINQAIRIYQEFINGSRTADEEDIKKISTPTGEPERRVETKYTMVDVTGDGIPELHVYGARNEYWIFTVKGDELCYFTGFNSYMSEYHLLENGAFLFKENDRFENYGEYYEYFELDASGEPINEVKFSWVSRDTDYWTYQEKDIYEFDGQICTYEEWYALTRKYLRTTVTGDEEVRNEVEWTRYCTFKH